MTQGKVIYYIGSGHVVIFSFSYVNTYLPSYYICNYICTYN